MLRIVVVAINTSTGSPDKLVSSDLVAKGYILALKF